VNVELVDRASLLHDILRVCDMKGSEYRQFDKSVTKQDKARWGLLKARYAGICHEEAACDLLKAKYPELALAIKKHRYAALLDEKDRARTWEEKLLYYADKRVMHDRIVPLKDRLDEAHKRHRHKQGTTAHRRTDTAKVDAQIFKLEQEIFDKIGLSPIGIIDEFVDSYSTKMHKRD